MADKTIKELIPITETLQKGLKQQLVNARDLWRFLEVESRFDDWFRNRVKEYDFKKDDDYWLNFAPKNLGAKNKQRGGHNRNNYLITLSMAKELAMVERNQQGKLARQYFIKCEEALLQIAPDSIVKIRQEWHAEREAVKSPYKKMSNALERCRQRQGKKTEQKHFINESNMLTSIVLGVNVQSWRIVNNISGSTREALDTEQLTRLEYLETADEMLLDMNITDFSQRKSKLSEMFKTKYLTI